MYTGINNIVVVPKEIISGRKTPFAGFSEILVRDYFWVFECLKILPTDIVDLFLSKKDYVKKRMILPTLSVQLLRDDFLDEMRVSRIEGFFNILWSTDATYEAASKAMHLFAYKPIHISSKSVLDAICSADFDRQEINNILVGKATDISVNDSDSEIREYFSSLVSSNLNNEIIYDRDMINSYGHNILEPLLNVLYLYGYEINLSQISIGENIQYYVKCIKDIVEKIDALRKGFYFDKKVIINDVLIYCPSIYAFLYNYNSKEWRGYIKENGLAKSERDIIKNGIVRIRDYSSFRFEVGESFDPEEIDTSLLTQRAWELKFLTNIISIFSASQFMASVRLPHAVMLHHDMLKDIANLVSSNKTDSIKLNRKFSKYSDSIKDNIGKDLLDLCFKNRKNIFSVCDFPIEWVSFDLMPLMFTHEISRVGTTPGDLLIQQLLSPPTVYIQYSVITNILVVRSYHNEDEIKNSLVDGINENIKNGKFSNLNIMIVDVNTAEEIEQALNSFEGAIVIFDCHGGHGGVYQGGWLEIGGDKVDIWGLSNNCVMKPIVILSACSTHPVSGSHASVANGFFKCGALSVLGSYGEINAQHSAIFVKRILCRISEYIPLILQSTKITWRKIISGMFKMSYATDVLKGMLKDNVITIEQYYKIHLEINIIINSRDARWHYELFSKVSSAINADVSYIEQMVVKKYQYTPTMLYTQLGRPEKIIIFNDISRGGREEIFYQWNRLIYSGSR